MVKPSVLLTKSAMKIIPSRFFFVLPTLLVFTTTINGAENLKGAAAVLQAVAEQSEKAESAANKPPAKELQEDLRNFSKSSENLSSEAAAGQWLALVDRFLSLDPNERMDRSSGKPLSAKDIVTALPPPKAWDALAATITRRNVDTNKLSELALKLIASALTGNKELRDEVLEQLQKQAESPSSDQFYLFENFFEQLNEALLESGDDPDAILRYLEKRLAKSSRPREYAPPIRVPNLVAIVGVEKTTAFLKSALTNQIVTLSFEQENATSRLARRFAIELLDQIKTPPWSLVNSLDATELYEALNKKFPKSTNSVARTEGHFEIHQNYGPQNGDRAAAEGYYLLGLISKNRSKEAAAIARKSTSGTGGSFPFDALTEMERAGYISALDNFFHELLSEDSSLPYWDVYVSLAAKAGRTPRMLALARSAAKNEKISRKERGSIHFSLFRALLADGQIDEGVVELRRLLAIPTSTSNPSISHSELSLNLARLGILIKKPEWIEEGIKSARNSITNNSAARTDWQTRSVPPALAQLLVDQNRMGEAEALLAEALAKSIDKKKQSRNSYFDEGESSALLMALASLYHQAGRPADVLALFDKAPYWGADDLADLFHQPWHLAGLSMQLKGKTVEKKFPLPWVAASALHAVNRTDEARKINNAYLDTHPGDDRAYELLLKLDGTNAMARLDALFARDQFEERPLIWKARLLADQKNFAAAEEVARKAISIDPSDGEQGPGDRIRAYAVLGEIRAARGDQKDAEFFGNVVKAIRLSEQADLYYAAGLLKQAVSMYRESLNYFADAYCIQSRLAIQLAELGLHAEAEAHYRKAYELMPDSFGRVESHCFGCEQAFAGAKAQAIAEKIFADLAAKQPNKPQVHYLLGYLRHEQQRYSDALPHLKKAIKLDPEYLNAWKKLLEASKNLGVSSNQREEIIFNLLRLDPMRRHSHPDLSGVTDLKRLWVTVEAANKLRPAKPESLLLLTASKAAREKSKTSMDDAYFVSFEPEAMTPAGAVSQTLIVSSAIQLLDSSAFDEE